VQFFQRLSVEGILEHMRPHIDKKNMHLAQNPYKEWLLDPHSLTEKLKSHCKKQFAVKKLNQKWHNPSPEEAKLLGLKPRQKTLIREVLLECDGTPWVYGRSLIPFTTTTGKLTYLRRLKNQSLGAELFKHPSLTRTHFDINLTPAADIPVVGALYSGSLRLFTRRSCFTVFNKQVLVAETFLPPCLGENHAPDA
jgi:chorismate--pyruvate lyase